MQRRQWGSRRARPVLEQVASPRRAPPRRESASGQSIVASLTKLTSDVSGSGITSPPSTVTIVTASKQCFRPRSFGADKHIAQASKPRGREYTPAYLTEHHKRGAPGIVRKQITVVADARPRPSRCFGRVVVRWIETSLRRASRAPVSHILAACQPCTPGRALALSSAANGNASAKGQRSGSRASPTAAAWAAGVPSRDTALLVPTLNITRPGLIGHLQPHACVAQPLKGSHGSLSRRLQQGDAARVGQRRGNETSPCLSPRSLPSEVPSWLLSRPNQTQSGPQPRPDTPAEGCWARPERSR
jgi:hypothetical protein